MYPRARSGSLRGQEELDAAIPEEASPGPTEKALLLRGETIGYAGDTGTDTRKVQRMILAMLEKLIGQPGMSAAGLAGMRGQSMMQMMAGGSPGGFAGGTNSPLMPATLGEAKDETWRKIRSRFDEQLGAAFEGRVPAKYRGLLNAYFDRLRKEPVR